MHASHSAPLAAELAVHRTIRPINHEIERQADMLLAEAALLIQQARKLLEGIR